MPTYTYSYPTDFPDGLDIAQLQGEINASAVGDDCDFVNWEGSVVDVVFTPTLSGAQETALDAVIAAHMTAPPVSFAESVSSVILASDGSLIYSGDGEILLTTGQ